MVAVESRYYSDTFERPHSVPPKPVRKILEIKVNRWKYLRDGINPSQAIAALQDIKEYAEQHSPYSRRARRENHARVEFLRRQKA